ncbi:MAG TPA: galactokinase [Anaeromyxobacter sp.]|nr:galactokinase [Anaeromyxobacter sp.]
MREPFLREFGEGGRIVTAHAPGRVNLMGEHTDYNEGFVLPMAIALGVRMTARARPDRQVRALSVDTGTSAAFPVDGEAHDAEHPWSNYLRGVLWALRRAGLPLVGMDLAFGGDLPQGAGLSSSAALETATALVARELAGFRIDPPRLALLCQQAENEFVGMKCGVMDQFVSLMGRAGHALFLDCRSLAFEQVPLALGEHLFAICHSGVKHALVASEYNRRRAQCTAGVAALAARFPGVKALRDATPAQLEACHGEMDPDVFRRCRHIVTENSRVLEGVEALRRGELGRFGALMDASHASQRDDFGVSCPEVDLLVELARAVPGVLGARITGGGFGGCTVNLVVRPSLERFREDVLSEYRRRTGLAPRLFVSAPADGARLE